MMETLTNPWVGSAIVLLSLGVLFWSVRAPRRPTGPTGRRTTTAVVVLDVDATDLYPERGPRPRPSVRPLPAIMAKDVTLERWRERAIDAELRAHDLEIELAEARRCNEVIARQLRLSPTADRLVVWLDVQGGNVPLSKIVQAFGIDRDAAERKVTALASQNQPIVLDRDRVRLRAVS